MRIPLDYYRILGLPIQATAEQLQQAHRDRTLQLPRREYSEAAIAARKQLIDEAHEVLSNPEERQAYDAGFLAKSYELEPEALAAAESEISPHATVAGANSAVDPYTPSIEIQDSQLVGALLILLELGEYELVIKLGRPYLSSGSGSVDLDQGRFGEPETVLADVVLTIALACLELGREQWQQGQYENAAESLDTGQELLRREGLFETIRREIQSDLYKLRPYRILELLALPETCLNERRRGLQLLQKMLQDRGGIDGSGDDYSGLNIDDFLRFIQQLRGYLTAAEQQTLFEAEARRPSAVATYLAVYALLARGFAQQQPALVRRAKQTLIRLSSRQDVHLEQAVCALLLGQTEEASRALELSQEYEPLAFIREHSQGAPDLLPGLCLYAERWLQQEVFPHFRDLSQQQASLKNYFANEQVQSYLEALPNESEGSNATPRVGSPLLSDPLAMQTQIAEDIRDWRTRDLRSPEAGIEPSAVMATAPPPDLEPQPKSPEIPNGSNRTNGSRMNGNRANSSRANGSRTQQPSPPASTAEYVSQLSPEGQLVPRQALSAQTATFQPAPLAAEPPDEPASLERSERDGEAPKASRSSHPAGRKGRSLRFDRIGLVFFGFLVSLAALSFLFSRAWRLFSSDSGPELLAGEQLQLELDRPPIEIPEPDAEPMAAGPLDEAMAQQVLEAWFSAKQAAYGADHAADQLSTVLVDPILSKRQQDVQQAIQTDWYGDYQQEVLDISVNQNPDRPDQATIEAQVREQADFYRQGQAAPNDAYDSTLRVRYDLVRQDQTWKIQNMTVLN